jgi:hypothetical protein
LIDWKKNVEGKVQFRILFKEVFGDYSGHGSLRIFSEIKSRDSETML